MSASPLAPTGNQGRFRDSNNTVVFWTASVDGYQLDLFYNFGVGLFPSKGTALQFPPARVVVSTSCDPSQVQRMSDGRPSLSYELEVCIGSQVYASASAI